MLGFRLYLHCFLDRVGRDDISNLVPKTFDVPSSGGLVESTLLFESLFQLHASDFGSHHFLCELYLWSLDLLLNSLDWDFAFALLSGTALAASVLCWTTGIQFLNRIWAFSTASSHLHFCGILSLRRHATVNNLVDELRLGNSTVFCVSRAVGTCLCGFMWDQLHRCDGLFQNRQWRTHIDDLFVDSLRQWRTHLGDLFVDSLWRELRLRTTVFAGVVNECCTSKQRGSPSCIEFLSVFFTKSSSRRVSENSERVLLRILTGSPTDNNCSSFFP